ncbi:MAG: hypothetical protein AB1750_03615 [Chloroflexota bacterium]
MLSKTSRALTYLLALLYALLGAALYVLPETLAPVFAWKVTPFMTMTIGGWCLANAWLAYVTARRWNWSRVHTTFIYLWLFGVSELIVLLAFRDKLNLAHPIAWLYLATLIVNALAALLGLADWIRIRPTIESNPPFLQPIHHFYAFLFSGFVAILGVYGVSAQIGAPGTNGGIFPEVMSLFTLRSFAVFYLSIALSSAPYIWEKSLNAVLHHAYASLPLIILVAAAAFVYIRLFDFANRPGGLVYIGVYLLVGIPILFALRKYGTGK